MKNWLLFLFSAFVIFTVIFSCITHSVNSKALGNDTIFVEKCFYDTVRVVDTCEVDSLAKSLKRVNDSLRFYRDTLRYEDYINKRKIEKIKYYISICNKNTKNKKFFFGWVKRTIFE